MVITMGEELVVGEEELVAGEEGQINPAPPEPVGLGVEVGGGHYGDVRGLLLPDDVLDLGGGVVAAPGDGEGVLQG